MMIDLSDRELLLLINSAHERAMRLLNVWTDMGQRNYASRSGRMPTADDIDHMWDGHIEHLELVRKLRGMRGDSVTMED